MFSPVSVEKGKPVGRNGVGAIGSDGSFTVSTYGEADGAVVGKHQLVFFPPPAVTPDTPAGAHTPTVKSPYEGLAPRVAEVEVKVGGNQLTVELEKAAPR